MSGTPRRLLAAAVVPGVIAAAVLAGSGAAGASTGTAEISPEQAGYTATGAQFKTITATTFLRQQDQYAGEVATLGHSVQLWSSGQVVTVGVTAATASGGYTTYATIYNRITHQVIASNPNAQSCDPDDNCSSEPITLDTGDYLTMTISYSPAADLVIMTADYGDGSTFTSYATITEPPQTFTEARVGTDFGSSPWDGSYSYTPPAKYVKIAAYTNVTLTTYSGHTATLWSWWVHHKLLANTEQQSGSDWVAVPTDLSSGGGSFQTLFVPQSAQGPDQPAPS
jgi:hypothetical protein